MNTSLGRNGLIGLAVGASAAFGFIAFIIYREMKSRKAQRMMLQPRPASQLLAVTDGVALLRDTHDVKGCFFFLVPPFLKNKSTINSTI